MCLIVTVGQQTLLYRQVPLQVYTHLVDDTVTAFLGLLAGSAGGSCDS